MAAKKKYMSTSLSIKKKLLFTSILLLLLSLFFLILAELSSRIFYKGPFTTGSLIVDDHELSFRLRTNVRCLGISPEFHVEYATDNQYGLRTETPGTQIKPPVKAIIYGDSFVFGHGVAFSDIFTSLLQKADPEKQILNAGVFNYGPDQEFLFARRLRQNLHPEIEIACFFEGNDFSDWDRYHILEFTNDSITVHPPSDPSGQMRRKLTKSIWYQWLCKFYLWHFFKTNFLERKFTAAQDNPKYNDKSNDSQGGTIKDIARMYGEWKKEAGGNFMVVFIPPINCIDKEDPRVKSLQDALKSADVPFFDLRNCFKSESKTNLYFPIDNHWTAKGHLAAFRAINAIYGKNKRPGKDE